MLYTTRKRRGVEVLAVLKDGHKKFLGSSYNI